jgi:hypothetical protein
VFTASWCCSVGTTWTIELRPVDRETHGRPAEWIQSGVPTTQSAPERQTADLLRERGLLLFPLEPADPDESPPRSRSRRPIGYVTRNLELMALALALAKVLRAGCDHAMIVAARWMKSGYPADTALRWVTAGVTSPELAQAHEPEVPTTLRQRSHSQSSNQRLSIITGEPRGTVKQPRWHLSS